MRRGPFFSRATAGAIISDCCCSSYSNGQPAGPHWPSPAVHVSQFSSTFRAGPGRFLHRHLWSTMVDRAGGRGRIGRAADIWLTRRKGRSMTAGKDQNLFRGVVLAAACIVAAAASVESFGTNEVACQGCEPPREGTVLHGLRGRDLPGVGVGPLTRHPPARRVHREAIAGRVPR